MKPFLSSDETAKCTELGLCSASDDIKVILSCASDEIAITVLGVDDGLAPLSVVSAVFVQIEPESE